MAAVASITMVMMRAVQFFYLLSMFPGCLVYLFEAVAVVERVFQHMLQEFVVYIHGVQRGSYNFV